MDAADPLCPPSNPQIVRVAAGADARVALELKPPIRGVGRVLSAATGEPIPFARVQPYCSGGTQRTFAWGAPVAVGADGTFDLDAFVLGVNYLTVSAPGFAERQAIATATTELVDWGEIRLEGTQVLRISIVDPQQPGEFTCRDIVLG